MPKRKFFSSLTASSDETPRVNQVFLPVVKKPKLCHFKVGKPVSIRYRWRANVRYRYWAWSRQGQRYGFLTDHGKGSVEFDQLPVNWKSIVQTQVVKVAQKDWQYRIFHKEKFYWSYDSWNVQLTPVIRFHGIRSVDKDEVDLSSDPSSS